MKEFVKEVLLNLLVEFILDCLKEKDMFGDMSFLICILGLYISFIVLLYNKIKTE